ncbi:MAG: hypothetical protein LBT39_11025 [Treponema sp.]|jgi:hypothetical protein|nr:hypothetical protein [Treponema sp.]
MAEPQAELWPASMDDEEAPAFFLPADAIREFIGSPKKPDEYPVFVKYLFEEFVSPPHDDKLWDLLAHLERETDFYTAPASTRFHGAQPCGLIRHSLLVLANGIKLVPVMLDDGVDTYFLAVSCLFHDLCKVNMYEQKLRNVKNEKTGEWEKEPFYSVKQDYIAYGHGIESLLRIAKFIELPESWKHAVRWHMGAYDISPMDKIAMDKVLAKYKEVLFLQTADMQAGLVEAI